MTQQSATKQSPTPAKKDPALDEVSATNDEQGSAPEPVVADAFSMAIKTAIQDHIDRALVNAALGVIHQLEIRAKSTYGLQIDFLNAEDGLTSNPEIALKEQLVNRAKAEMDAILRFLAKARTDVKISLNGGQEGGEVKGDPPANPET